MLYAVLNFGIVQSDKLAAANKKVTDAAVARVKLIANAVQLVKEAGSPKNKRGGWSRLREAHGARH